MGVFQPGKYLRFPELFNRETPIVVCPVDDLLLTGPANGLEDAERKIRSMLAARPTALLAFYGTIANYYREIRHQTRIIINLSASSIRSDYTKKVIIGSIETALRINASAVAVHINVNSSDASKMISDAAAIIEQADRYGMPTVGIMYPRGENADGSVNEYDDLKQANPEEYSKIIAHCVHIGVELGFDLIKTQYSGTPESFKKVIKAAQSIPVVIAGGPLKPVPASVDDAKSACGVGASGISFARNVFGRDDPQSFIDHVRRQIRQEIAI